MVSTNVSVSLFLDTRRIKGINKYPIKCTVYFESDKKRYSTGIDLTKEEWEKINGSNLRDEQLKITKRKLTGFKEKVEKAIEQIESFSFSEFEKLFYSDRIIRKQSDLSELFTEYVCWLETNGRIGTAISYQTTLNSLLAFRGKIRVTEITIDYLNDYEKFMLSKKLSPSTIGIYLRQLRRIVNIAIQKGIIKREKYPFTGYSIPASRNVKKALDERQIRLLLKHQTKDNNQRMALDFWLFSYISNGINMTDVCYLKPENLQKDFFFFYRAKTKNTKKKDLRPIKVPLLPITKSIIERWRSRDEVSRYLFPILSDGLSPRQEKYKIQDFIAKINKHMKIIAKQLKIDSPIGTYVARHSHSTILKRKGVPTELIKENLGHSSILITESYLADFSDEDKLGYARLLTNLN